jgi:hypothetical protein
MQRGEFRRRVARDLFGDVSRFNDRHAPARMLEQVGGEEPYPSSTDDRHVDFELAPELGKGGART